MAEEVGQGYVSVVPSMKSFSRLVKAELAKSFKGGQLELSVKPVFDKAALGKLDPISVPVTPDFGDAGAYRARLKALLGGTATQRVDLDIDRSVGQRIFSKIFGGSEAEVDRDRIQRSITGALGGVGGAGVSAGQTFMTSFTSVITSPTTGLLVAIAAPFLAAPAAVLAAVATAGGVLAGAGIGALLLGGFGLRNDPELKAAVGGLMSSIDKGLTDAAQPLKGPFLAALATIGKALEYVMPTVKSFFKTIADSGAIKELATGFSGFIKSFADTGALDKLATAIGPMLTQIGMALPDLGNAFSQFIISVTKVSPQAIDFIGKTLRGLADVIRFAGDAIEWLSGKWDTLKATVGFFRDVISNTVYGLQLFVGALTGNAEAISILTGVLVTIGDWLKVKWAESWDKARAKAGEAIGGVATFARGIPGMITSAVGDLGSLLKNAGGKIISGLIDGIMSKFGALKTAASAMASLIGGFFPHSPAKWGPLSGSGSPELAGQTIATMLAGGMTSQLPKVSSASAGLAGAVAYGSGSGAQGAAAASSTITLDTAGSRLDQVLLEVLRESIRVRNGGNVQLAIGTGRA